MIVTAAAWLSQRRATHDAGVVTLETPVAHFWSFELNHVGVERFSLSLSLSLSRAQAGLQNAQKARSAWFMFGMCS